MATPNRVSDADTLKKGIQYFSDGMLYAFRGFDDQQKTIKTKINNVEKFDIMMCFDELDFNHNPTGVVVKVCHGTFMKTVATLVNDSGVAKINRRNLPIYTGTMIDQYKVMWQKCATYGEWKTAAVALFQNRVFKCSVTNHTDRIRTYDFDNKSWIKTYDDSKDGWTSYQLDNWVKNPTKKKNS